MTNETNSSPRTSPARGMSDPGARKVVSRMRAKATAFAPRAASEDHREQRLADRRARLDRRMRSAGALQRECLADARPQPPGGRQRERALAQRAPALGRQTGRAQERHA